MHCRRGSTLQKGQMFKRELPYLNPMSSSNTYRNADPNTCYCPLCEYTMMLKQRRASSGSCETLMPLNVIVSLRDGWVVKGTYLVSSEHQSVSNRAPW